jgi:diadenosine tetraphosphate (Ap4A) HIT family hydrolase
MAATMDRLWAGWRSSYVTAAAEGEPPAGVGADVAGEGSLFSRILAAGVPDEESRIVWRGELVFAILNAFPYTSGHVLVMPYREVPEIEDLTDEENIALWAGVRDAVVAIKRAYRPHGLNVGINLGEAGGAGIPSHLHVHVLPRWGADSNFMTAVAETRVLPESLSDSWRKLRDAWPTTDSGTST